MKAEFMELLHCTICKKEVRKFISTYGKYNICYGCVIKVPEHIPRDQIERYLLTQREKE